MAVIKEWRCGACGTDFDSEIPACGRCGATEPYVIRAFRTAPGFKGDKTKVIDQSLQNFTKHYGLSDFTNNQSTMHEKKYMGADGKPISVDDMWAANEKGVVSSNPDPAILDKKGNVVVPGESRFDLIKSFAKEAVAPIREKKIVLNKEKVA